MYRTVMVFTPFGLRIDHYLGVECLYCEYVWLYPTRQSHFWRNLALGNLLVDVVIGAALMF